MYRGTRDTIEKILVRFLDKVSPEPNTGCWLWTSTISNVSGYGSMWAFGKTYYAHRLSHMLFIGELPPGRGMDIDHKCRVRCCVNPAHLELVTHRENTRRGVSFYAVNAKKTHCESGHEFTATNTYIRKDGYRDCKECHRIREVQVYREGRSWRHKMGTR